MIVISQASNIPGLFFSKKPLTHKNKHRHSDLSWSCLPSVCIHGKFSQTPHWSYTYLFWATRGDCADFRFSMLTRCDGRFADPSTTPHDHTWSLLLTTLRKLRLNWRTTRVVLLFTHKTNVPNRPPTKPTSLGVFPALTWLHLLTLIF